MSLRSMLFAIGLGTLWGGEKAGVSKLPDSVNASVTFSPDGRQIHVLQAHRLYSWDVEARRVVRERKIPQAQAGITFSPGGAFMVLAVKEPEDQRTSISLIRMRDGETVFSRVLPNPEGAADPWYTQQSRDMLAASDDGRWVAAYRLDTRELEIVSVADGRTSFKKPLEPSFRRIAFNPGGDRLFASIEPGEKHSAIVFALSRGTWEGVAALDGALDPSWHGAGLAFATSRGISIWDGGKTRLAVPNDPPFDPQPDGIEPRWRISPDGLLCILWNRAALAVRATASGALVAARDVDTGGIRAVLDVAFSKKSVRALLSSGELVDVDVAARSIARRGSFGRPGHYFHNLFQEGASWSTRYTALLSPTGRHLALLRPNEDWEIHLTE